MTEAISPPSPTRRAFTLILAACLIFATIIHTWYFDRVTTRTAQSSDTSRPLSFDEQVVQLQTRLIIGSRAALNGWVKNPLLSGSNSDNIQKEIDAAFSPLKDTLSKGSTAGTRIAEIQDPTIRRTVTRDYTALVLAINGKEGARSWHSQVSTDAARGESEQTTDVIISRLLTDPAPKLSPSEIELLDNQMGWFSSVLRYYGTGDENLREPVIGLSQKTFKRVLTGFGVIGILVLVSLVSFGVMAFRFMTGRSRFEGIRPGMPTAYSLEIFALYMLAMFSAPFLTQWAARFIPGGLTPSYVLIANCVLISSLLLLVLWPLVSGVPLHAVFQTLGIAPGGLGKLLRDIVVAPFFYLGFWVILAAILLLYSLLITSLGVDVSQGTHPVVPILLSSGNEETKLLVIFLAVVIAPVIEETMFRGALYSWLRTRCSFAVSVLLCGFIFAVIHPQGPIGIVPLMSIGMALCFLREWRGSIYAPMVAHACFNGGTVSLLFLIFGE